MILLFIVCAAALGLGLLLGSILPMLRGPDYTGPEWEQIGGLGCILTALAIAIISALLR